MIDKRADAIARGNHAQAILESPIMQDAFRHIEDDLIERWKHAKTVEAREECWRMLDSAARLRSYLLSAASNGKLTQQMVNRNV